MDTCAQVILSLIATGTRAPRCVRQRIQLAQLMYLAVQLASMSDERLEPQGHWCCIAIRLAMEILSGMHDVVVKDIVQAIIMRGYMSPALFV